MTPEDRRKPRVLVVDDYPDAADLLAEALSLGGYEVATAHDGPAAIELADRDTHVAAFIDIGMPGMDGYEVARRLRARPSCSGMYLVALTGHSGDTEKRRSSDAGFDAHLVKPVDVASVTALLDKRLRA